ncbi:reverse transcriptase [Phytophthora megakarya]|uniref:Reverse transcriptase n=1 Tax=Phytophthora megakarya TaxID=4795 RepID=A0A225V1L9_9STRA|nr:reverse transcriptase [Phytophthora megakarya]
MQSFLGSLNYYSRLIEDYAIYASVLYELREVEKRSDLREIMDWNDPIPRDLGPPELKLTGPVDERWIRAHRAFIAFKTKIATTPILRHFDETRTLVVIVYAIDWAISASLTQEHDGIYHPVAFASRTLKTNELNYNVTEKEVLAVGIAADLGSLLRFASRTRDNEAFHLAWLFKSTGLQGRLGRWSALLAPWTLEITKCMKVHVKRDWNGGADSLASVALQRQGGIEVHKMPGHQDLVTLNRSPAGVMQEDLIREIRVDWIKQAQEVEVWIAGMKKYLSGSIADLTQAEARSYGKIAADYEEDIREWDVPTSGSGDHFHWSGLYRSVQRYVVDCETGKGKPVIRGGSPGNLQATYPFQIIAMDHISYPFQIIAMDHIPSQPRSHKGNTELLIWVGLFTGYVIAKASSSRSAQTVAESYEECVFRRFGASEMIRHDRELFRSFKKILGQRQRATMAYRPQANGTAERMVQTATRVLKMYVRDLDQKDWDEYAERLSFAINTAHDGIRGDTPHYLVHGSGEGYARKLAHLWHGPFRVAEKINEFSVKLEIANEADRLDFDEILLPEDSWVPDLGADEYEVERISDVRSGKKTRFGRIYREFLVHWAGYAKPT